MEASIGSFTTGDILDIISGTITSATVMDASGTTKLLLSDEGSLVASISLADQVIGAGTVYAVPDAVDGTRLIVGPAALPVAPGALMGATAEGPLAWGGAPMGRWSNPLMWRQAGGQTAAWAPGSLDAVRVAGPQSAMLAIAGDGSASTLTTSGDVALSGSFDLSNLIVGSGASDVLALTADCQVTASAVQIIQGVLQLSGEGARLDAGATLAVGDAMLWVADSASVSAVSLLLTGGTLRVGRMGSVVVGHDDAAPLGVVDITSESRVSGHGVVRCAVQNNGTIVAQAGGLELYGAVTGTGTEQIDPGAALYLPYGASVGGQVSFSEASFATGTLELFGSAATCAAAIINIGIGDKIDIASATIERAVWTPPGAGQDGIGILDLGTAGSLKLGLAAGINPAEVNFVPLGDGLGGTVINIVPCFVAGTLIASPGEPTLVEDIKVGQRVLTRSGAARRVVWIGSTTVTESMLRTEPHLRPVRIVREALGPGIPHRDLLLSPQHAILVSSALGTHLVPCIALVDGHGIVREDPNSPVAYHHFQLESHDVVSAEGAWAETYLAIASAAAVRLDRSTGRARSNGVTYKERLESGWGVQMLRREYLGRDDNRPLLVTNKAPKPQEATWLGNFERVHVQQHALILEGWIRHPESQDALELNVFHDGVLRRRAVANMWRSDLDLAHHAGGRCAFATTIPWSEPLTGLLSIQPV